jgi:hypothetical protein
VAPLTAPGLSGHRNEYLLCAWNKAGALRERFEQGLASVVKQIVLAQVPPEIQPLLKAGAVVALDPAKVRPVVMGDMLLKTAERYMVDCYKATLAPVFQKAGQYGGPGVKGGPEAASQVLRALLSAGGMEAHAAGKTYGKVAISTDVFNAYNSLHSSAIAKVGVEFMPEAVAFLRMMYGSESNLYYDMGVEKGIATVICSNGVRQGAPISTIIFCLAYLAAIRDVSDATGGEAVSVAIADDNFIVVPVEQAATAMKTFKSSIKRIGLRPNEDKYCMWAPKPSADGNFDETAVGDELAQILEEAGIYMVPADGAPTDKTEEHWNAKRSDALQAGAPVIPYCNGIVAAGVPVGIPEFVKAVLEKSLIATEKLAEGIKLLAELDLQCALLLLRYCLPGRITHLLRALPPEDTPSLAEDFDDVLLRTYYELMQINDALFDNDTYILPSRQLVEAQIRAPIKTGGMGLPAMAEKREACHVASYFLTASVVQSAPGLENFVRCVGVPAQRRGELTKVQAQLVDALEAVRQQLPEEEGLHSELEPEAVMQTMSGAQTRGMQAKIINAMPSNLLRLGTHRDAARIESLAGVGAQAYLTTVPKCYHSRLSSTQMLISGLMALGLPLPPLAGVRQCCWGHGMDESGRHLVAKGCGRSTVGGINGAYTTVRHNRMVDIWVKLLENAGLRGQREPPLMPGMPPDRRADIQVNDFPSFGKVTLLDLTVRAVLKGDGDTVASYKKDVPGSVAAAAVKKKLKSYKDLRVAGLVVMAHEQFGRMNVEADELLRQLAHRETALRLDLGAEDPREANPSYPAVFGAVLAYSRKLLSVGLAKQNAESVIRGYKGATLYAEPAARLLEDLELADVVDLVSVDRGADAGAGVRAGGGDGAA